MRPVELRLRGLHSYREPQVIDFTAAIERGIFGIFGPTGSGKSTVLDAITLALFGEVPRAPRGTQGIVNLAEKAAEVAYTFELRDGERVLRYRAERRYTRVKDGPAAHAETCRLVELTGGSSVVLADKADDMTRRVADILGLTADDFTRAVVLPQGRFAEFLHLRGQGRRAMLQRLFDLERYGERLSERLKARLADLTAREGALKAELEGIGDASPERVARARAEAQEALEAALLARTERDRAQAALAQLRAIRSLEEQLREIETQRAKVQAQDAAMHALGERLALARRAEALRDVLEHATTARRAAVAAAEERNQAEAQRVARSAAAQEALAAWGAWQSTADPERSRLEGRQRDLVEAVELEGELADRVVAWEAARAAAATAAAERAGRETHLAEMRNRLEALVRRRTEIDAEVGRLRVPAEVRLHNQRALAELYRVGEAEERWQAARTERERADAERMEAEVLAVSARGAVAEAERSHRDAAAALEKLAGEAHPDEEALREEVRFLEMTRAGWLECVRRAADVRTALARAEEAGEALRKAQVQAVVAKQHANTARIAEAEAERAYAAAQAEREATRRADLAGHLAQGLVPGEPCPVCGSVEHPSPAVPTGAAGDRAAALERRVAEAEAQWSGAREAARQAEALRIAAESALSAAETRHREVSAGVGEAREDLASAVAQLAPDLRAYVRDREQGLLDETHAQVFLTRADALLREREAQGRRWRNALDQARAARDAAAEAWREAAERESQARAALAAREASQRAAAERAQVAERDQMEAIQAFARIADGQTPEEVEAEADAIAARDTALEGLERERIGVTAGEQEQQGAVAAAERGVTEARTAESERNLDRERLEGEIGIARERLARLLGKEGTSAREALERTRAALEALAAEGRRRAEMQAQTAEAATQAEIAAEKARALAESAIRAQAAHDTELAARLSQAGFADEAAVQSALLSLEEMTEAEETLRRYEELRVRLQDEASRLTEELAGRTASDELLARAETAANEADAAETAARERAGAAKKALSELQERAIRWQAAVEKGATVREELGVARDLEAVVHGGQFLDFIAEEYLRQIAAEGSARLGGLTRYRYALELDSEGGFQVRDDHNGGQRRPVTSLSGGETFLASLALALALSTQVQLRGRFPLEFFFLDEGFGSLDAEVLETVVNALERLRLEHVHIGLITHVQDLRGRVPARLVVEPAVAGERGSRIRFEVE